MGSWINPNPYHDGALVGKLQGITDEIQDHLPEFDRIGL
jgi:hypothetical protein